MPQSPKKTALWLLIASVAVSAILGIWEIRAGEFGYFQVRVLSTTMTITAASVCGLACGALWETGRIRVVPLIGIIRAVAASAMLIVGIWRDPHSELYYKFAVSTCFLAVATAHVCLLSLARLARRLNWAQIAAYVVVYLLAGLGIVALFGSGDGDVLFRAIGVVAILVGAISVITPVFHRLSTADLKAAGSIAPESAAYGRRPPARIAEPLSPIRWTRSSVKTAVVSLS